ncbi:hypothetical protein ACFX1X_012766 [Malus domestica]
MIKWAIALGEFDISYQSKPAEKGQAVADFIDDFTYPVDIVSTPKKVVSLPSKAQKIEPTAPAWSLYVDGSSNQQGCGAGLVLTTLTKWRWSMLFVSNSRRRTMRPNMKPS